MKKLFVSIAAIALFASCKKENTAPEILPGTTKNPKTISSVYDDGSIGLTTYIFDAQGRLTSSKNEEDGDTRTMTFNYSTAGKILVTESINNVPAYTNECILNDKGYITSRTTNKMDGSFYVGYKYTYNSDGYMTKYEWNYPNGSKTHFEIEVENGNVTGYKLFYDGVQSNSVKYTYDNSKLNTIKSAVGSSWIGPSFGKTPKNLVSNIKVTNMSGVVTWNVNSSYQLDAQGAILKESKLNLLNNSTTTDNYTY